MKQANMKKLFIIGAFFLSVPTLIYAQNEQKEKKEKKEVKERKEVKEKKEVQTIVITRNAADEEKTVIEINGDKVKINGKDADENKDVHVNIHKIGKGNVFSYNNGSGMNMDNMNLFSEDENRAMLGVVTEGNDKGAEIQSISKESAAEKAGLMKGDIITKIGDQKVESTEDVTDIIHEHKPGDKVNIEILRDGKEQKITAELGKWKGIKMNNIYMPKMREFNQKMGELNGHMGEMNEDGNWNVTPMPPMTYNFNYGGRPKLGLSIQDTDDGNGVKVLDVDEESNAAKAGIEQNDIIVKIDDKEIKGTDDVTSTMRANKDKNSYAFSILRDGKKMILDVKVPRKLKTADL